RREVAKEMGADVVLDPAAIDCAKQIRADTSGRGVDCVFDCAAKDDTMNVGANAVRNGGRIALTGIHSHALVPFETSPMRRKELVIYNVRRSNDESEAALEMLAGNTAWFAPLLT